MTTADNTQTKHDPYSLAWARHYNILATEDLDLQIVASPVSGANVLFLNPDLPWEDVLRLQRAIELALKGGRPWRNETPCHDDCPECGLTPRADDNEDEPTHGAGPA
ncbi:hypothetical protein FHN55_08985 [Streptomyces sp. NP160]|uniref:hypothetical protein n=1 Tax=Streptomyces sp. NP160 TaxID=2586637 RepID=UPI0011187945|nr:hypothetical protein [Streptomyces sp. NP160]TNM67584.1 hypothetical protein FHN55_08985 [Streptomyces sp. NP160]